MAFPELNDVFISNAARPIVYAVYIAGVRVPCQSVTVNSGVWQFPTAEITVPPDIELARLGTGDRAHVAIFYWDTYYVPDNDFPKFRLLFEGEIMGWSYSKNAHNKNIAYRAIGYPFVFTQYFLNMLSDDVQYQLGELSSQGSPVTNVYKLEDVSAVTLWTTGLQGSSALGSPKAYIDQSIKFLNGKSVLSTFFRNYIKSNNMSSRVSDFAGADDVFNFLAEIGEVELLKATMGKVDQLLASQVQSGSLWDHLTFIFQKMFHEIYMTSTPKDSSTLVDMITKPQTYFTAVPKCNVIFPSMTINWNFSEDYWSAPTRTITRDNLSATFAINEYNAGAEVTMANIGGSRATSAGSPNEGDALKGVAASVRRGANLQFGMSSVITEEEEARGPVTNSTKIEAMYKWMSFASGGNPDMIQKWCDYKHYEARATARRGSLALAFNPYITHSFPAIIFDSYDDQIHMQGYVTAVAHTLSTGSASSMMTLSSLSPLGPGGEIVDASILLTDSAQKALAPDGFPNEGADKIYTSVFGNSLWTQNQGPDGAPNLNSAYHSYDIVDPAESEPYLPGLTKMGSEFYTNHDSVMKHYSSRPIMSMDNYLKFYSEASLEWFDAGRQSEYTNDHLPRPPDKLVGAEGVTPWTRTGSKNPEWAEKVEKVLRKSLDHNIFFSERGG